MPSSRKTELCFKGQRPSTAAQQMAGARGEPSSKAQAPQGSSAGLQRWHGVRGSLLDRRTEAEPSRRTIPALPEPTCPPTGENDSAVLLFTLTPTYLGYRGCLRDRLPHTFPTWVREEKVGAARAKLPESSSHPSWGSEWQGTGGRAGLPESHSHMYKSTCSSLSMKHRSTKTHPMISEQRSKLGPS